MPIEDTMNTIQALVLPNLHVHATQDMYLRLNSRAWASLDPPLLHFEPGGVASTDTFYNGFTVGTWKRHCGIRQMALRFRGSGRFVASIGLHRHGQASVWLQECKLSLCEAQACELPLPVWSELSDGMLFFRLRSLDGGTLEAADYVTADLPSAGLRLGLVITHFNRIEQVMPAIDRIRKSLLQQGEWQGRITLTVVDNSRNLPMVSEPGIEVIPNRNLGGTGGFVRGLLALMDRGDTTHALFMDDDASCETASIARTFALLQYSNRPRLAVAGALLRELAPWHLFEKGARFRGKVEPLWSGLDMRRVEHLLLAEKERARPDYGAWWFFAFPIAEVRHMPFPFFVRGDDIMFGLQNAFHITTLNGVACFGEDFGTKHSPLTAYLDARYHLVQALLSKDEAAARIFWIAGRLFLKALTSYHYSSARAVTLALQHTLQGPSFFADNLDLGGVRREIGSWMPNEKLLPIQRTDFNLRGARQGRESPLRRLCRVLTLQGFLLPAWLIRKQITVQEKGFHGSARAVFRYRRVLYEHEPSGTGYIAEYDRPRFFREAARFLSAFVPLLRRRDALRQRYEKGVESMTSLAFWQDVYRGEAAGPPDTRAVTTARTTLDLPAAVD